MYDFQFITQIHVFTDKCGPKELQRFEEANKKLDRITLADFLLKAEAAQSAKGNENSKNGGSPPP